jgi:hypothetical protein
VSALELRVLPLRSAGLLLAGAVALLSATARALDSTATATQVLLGLAVLIAATLALAVDEPAAELLDAAPTAFARRVLRRLAALAGVALPLWAVGLLLADVRGADVAVGMATLELAALCALSLGAALGLRRWRRLPEPAIVAGPVLLGFLVIADQLPRSLVLMARQPWGPPWEVAHLRWSAVLLAGLSLLLLGLSDPATGRTSGVRARKG